MSQQVVMGAMLKCSFGVAPSSLVVLPSNCVMCNNVPAATIMDSKPMANIMPFGMCNSPLNPAVMAVLGSPMPCIPNIVTPWTPGCSTVKIGNSPALNNTSKCTCLWAGVIEITNAGQTNTNIA